ncbi:hypothetical protein AB4Z11_32580, partial [Pseudoduganella sp. RAF53_2]
NSLNKGGSISGTWDATSKIQANAAFRRETRRFEPLGGVIFNGDASDTTRSTTVGLQYTPVRQIQLNVSGFHEKRSGSPLAGTGSYKANGFTVSATAQF